jgi:hypothetical protein
MVTVFIIASCYFQHKSSVSSCTGLNQQRFVLIVGEMLFKEMIHERNAFDHRIHRNLSAVADLCAAENGNFHLNAQCLSGDRQKKDRDAKEFHI